MKRRKFRCRVNCNIVTLCWYRTPVLLQIIARDRAERHWRHTPVNPKVATLSKKQKLTPEQERIRLRGLRLLARMIARTHLESQGAGGMLGGDGDGDGPLALDGEDPREDGEHVR